MRGGSHLVNFHHLIFLSFQAINSMYFLFSGYTTYLARDHQVEFPPNQYWYCSILITVLAMAMFCGSLLLVAMTFGRFYSIVRPHKAVSFNTIRRTKMTIIIAVLFSILFNIPNLFISDNKGWECMPFAKAGKSLYGKTFYWLALAFEFVLHFVLLLVMNSVIIHKLNRRFNAKQKQDRSTESGTFETVQRKNSDTQIFIMLLLVTFGFLVLVTPAYVFFLYVILVDYLASPKTFAGYYLFHSVAQKFRFSNHGVNFFFYVISGEKFRTDLKKLIGFPTKFEKKEVRQKFQLFQNNIDTRPFLISHKLYQVSIN